MLFHFLNASAIENRRIALGRPQVPGASRWTATRCPIPQLVETIFLGAGERIDAIVEMNNPGNWILGAHRDLIRNAGLGVIVEYANQHSSRSGSTAALVLGLHPLRQARVPARRLRPTTQPQQIIDMVFEKIPRRRGQVQHFHSSTASPTRTSSEFVLHQGRATG